MSTIEYQQNETLNMYASELNGVCKTYGLDLAFIYRESNFKAEGICHYLNLLDTAIAEYVNLHTPQQIVSNHNSAIDEVNEIGNDLRVVSGIINEIHSEHKKTMLQIMVDEMKEAGLTAKNKANIASNAFRRHETQLREQFKATDFK
jgi:hypothetical protein